MKLTIGSTVFEGANCERMRHNKEGFYLSITIPKESTNLNGDEVRALFNGTTETIIVIKEDGTENNYSGYNKSLHFETEDNEYTFWQVCRSELEAQLGLAKDEIKALTKKNAEHEQSINNQNTVIGGCVDTINQHTDAINQQNEVINAQSKFADSLAEADMMQTATLESLLLEVIPTVVSDAVTVAVAEALATLTPSEGEANEVDSEAIEESEEEV